MSTLARMEPCAFCAIVRGEAPAAIVLETPEVVAFLDHRPVFPGHILLMPRAHVGTTSSGAPARASDLMPRAHVGTLDELPDALVAPLFTAARRLSVAVQRALGAGGTFVAVNNRISQSVPHLHVHVVPRRAKDGLRGFFWPRQRYESDAALAATQSAIRAALT